MTTQLSFDICARKHGGNPESVAAHARVEPHKANMREQLRLVISGSGFSGCTLKELCWQFAKTPNAISGRLSELRRDELVFDSGRRRDGCAVLVGWSGWAVESNQ